MEDEPIFGPDDLRLIESLVYDSSLEPRFDALRACLVWRDEEPKGLTPDGYNNLCRLWIARSFLHRGLDFFAHPLDPEFIRQFWQRAGKQGFKWTGFERLTLSTKDKEYYEKMLHQENPF